MRVNGILSFLSFCDVFSADCRKNLQMARLKGLQKLLGTLSKSLRRALIRLPEVNFSQNETLRMYVGCIQP